ncbi:GlmU family protein [Daejeonella oryzae]|uniref:GlmU family protein n=1 Tax=Daejeonella oryzae TaxID=1122943 RepID=UPI0003FF9FC7|nr:GlmU family protein [Daejeonella oryzae]
MRIILFDDQCRNSLLPLTFTRPVSALRIGILTIFQKWEKWLKAESSFLTAEYLQEKFPIVVSENNYLINGSICPDEGLLEAIDKLSEGDALFSNEILLALKLNKAGVAEFKFENTSPYNKINYSGSFVRIVYPEDIFKNNDVEIRKDFKLITHNRSSAAISSTNTILGDHIFAEEGAEAECSSFNTKSGPVYLGKNSQVWEGSHIRGSFALCENSQVKMGAKIYGMTTIGPHCRVAGEITNSVIMAYSSKGHEGYLGNSVLGEWCNIGADSNNSNLKNNYAEVRLWDYNKENFRKTGLQFCGLIMADHSKCAINTMFNTGTVVGVSANIFGSGFPRNFIPDFSWGGSQGLEVYTLNKMFETAEKVYERRNLKFEETDKKILAYVFDQTIKHRRF